MRDSDFHFKSNKTLPRPKNIILVGLTGGGKTIIGQSLAQQFGLGFLDLDQTIEESQKKKIDVICTENGISYFRDLESKGIAGLVPICNHVIATGSGALQKDENFQFLKEIGLFIWIDTPLTTIAWRLSRNLSELKKRPLLADLSSEGDAKQRYLGLVQRLEAMLVERGERYREAEVVFRDSSSAPEICARRIIHLIGRHLSGKKSPN